MADANNLKLGVTNFGPIASAEIDLRPLTVFVGPSNTGKSYLAVLIYALHRFFNGDAVGPGLHGRMRHAGPITRSWPGREEKEIPENDINSLLDWVKREDFGGPLPDAIAMQVRTMLRDVSNLGNILEYEMARCFGIEDTTKLIRHSSGNVARIDLNREVSRVPDSFEPFKYRLTMKNGETELEASIPETAPLRLETEAKQEIIELGTLLNRNRDQYLAQILVGTLSDIAGSEIVNPLSRLAYYLPADRTGVMHAHRVVVGSLIARAPRAGLGRVPTEPVLSGVLADFLEQLIGLGDSPRRGRSGQGDLSKRLEVEMLRGAILSENSDIGYPEFSYRPEGWSENISLMNSSSMISELAPVVLYLRHIVQPGDVLIIEEPESHLHPAMQVEFIRQLAGVVRSGIRVMLTTHSEWVLEELAYLIRLSELPKSGRMGIDSGDFALKPCEVGVWRFDSKKRPNGTVVKEIQLDPEIGNFESGYDDVAINVHNRWAEVSNLIEERRAQ